VFANRIEAGTRLARQLTHLRGQDLVVVGLPRGGVPVAYRVAHDLGAPLDVILVRKLGVPFQPELAMGAIGEGDVRVIDEDLIRLAGISDRELARVEERERVELERRATRYRAGLQREPLAGRVVVVVDDGIATGSTARAACQVARLQGASRVVLATPVAPADWTRKLADAADELIAIDTPEPFHAIGQFYRDFSPTTDDEVVRWLERARAGGR
jgi:putative phosphoribosyl transferase